MIVGARTQTESNICSIVSSTRHLRVQETAHAIYIAHVKPLEDALKEAEAERDDWAFRCGQRDARLHRAQADNAEMVEALETMLKAYEMILPGVAKISIPDYALMNEAPCKAHNALARVKEPTNDAD